jgi:3-hydroxybutyryl-CoA dehydratase
MKIKIDYEYSKNFKVTMDMIEKFSLVTGDKNPIHLDKEYAQKSLFKKRIAHGFLIGSFISTVIGNYFPGNGTIYLSQSLKFMKPVFIGDNIVVKVKVISKTDKNWLLLKTDCFNSINKIVLEGEAMVIPPKGT